MTTKDTEALALNMTELKKMADLESVEEKQKVDEGYTVDTINNAIQDGDVNTVKEWLYCLEQRDLSVTACQIDTQDDDEHTFLANAIERKQPEIALLLVCAGADFTRLQEWTFEDLTPVHQAAKKGYLELLEKMVELNPECVDLDDDQENTPLHWACSEGHAEVASALIQDHGAKLDARDCEGLTPLHVACREGRVEVVRTLITDHHAKVDVRDKRNATPLHWTGFKNVTGEVVRLLLDHGARPNATDKSNQTPLRRACRWGRAAVAKALLDHEAKVDIEDSDGLTPLEVAIQQGAIECAMAVVESSQWKKALQRYNSKMNSTPFRELVAKMPEVAEKVLDRCCKACTAYSRVDEKFWMEFNFEFIEDLQEGAPGSKQGKGNYFSTKWGPKTKFSKSTHPLAIMAESKESRRVLAHPLVCCLLHYKWLKFGQLVFFINLFIYCLFLLFLTAFTLIVPHPLSGTCSQPDVSNATLSPNDTSHEENQNTCEGLSSTTRVGLYFTAAVVIVSVIFRLVLEGYQVATVKWRYFISWVNWMEICLYSFSFIFVWVFQDSCLCPYQWQWQLGIVAVFLAWINLLVFFSDFPLTGVYVLMFTTICRTFLKILALSLLLVIAFALTFFLIFHDPRVMPSPFSSPAAALFKLSSMTAGDFSFNTVLGFESDGVISFPIISYIMWILFIIVMPILFANMLIGLASGDTQEIQKEATLSQLALLVGQVLTIEELLFNTHRRKLKIGKKRVYPNKNFDDSEPIFSTCIDSKLPRSVLSTFGGWLKTLNHVMWGGKEYDTLDSLTRVLNPEEFFTEERPFESVKQKIIDVNERVVEKTQEQRRKEIGEVKEALHHLQSALEEMKQQVVSRDEMKEALSQHQQVMIAETRALLKRKIF